MYQLLKQVIRTGIKTEAPPQPDLAGIVASSAPVADLHALASFRPEPRCVKHRSSPKPG